MAAEAEEVNTTAEVVYTEQQAEINNVCEPATGDDVGDSDERGQTVSSPVAAVENPWTAPLLSLARKATETISSGMSYASAPRLPSQGSAGNSPTEKEPENGLLGTGKRLPGKL